MNGGSLPIDAGPPPQVEANGPPDATRRRRRSRRVAVWLLLGAVAAAAAVPGYETWHQRRTNQYHAACKRLVTAENWTGLEGVAVAWAGWDASNGDAQMFVAEAAIQQGRTEDAAAALGRIQDDYHGALQALAVQGDLLFTNLNRPYAAAETWRRMLRINPRADVAWQRLIYFNALSMQRRQMLEDIRRAIEHEAEPPEAYTYLLLAYDITFSDGLRLTRKWLDAYPDDPALNVAQAVYRARYSPDETVEIFGMSLAGPGDETLITECLEKYPDNLEVLAYHAERAVVAGDRARVYDLLSHCPVEAEDDPRFWRYRGWYLAENDEFAEAEQALQSALSLHPTDWRSRLLLSGVLRQLDRHEEAAREAQLANFGKELHRKIFELPNARALNDQIVAEMDQYFEWTADPLVLQSWKRFRE
jgi:tetratricopeptide (TPR) repeat protein